MEKIDLQSMLNNNQDYEDNTDLIRELKHSNLIATALSRIESLKRSHVDLYKSNFEEFNLVCQRECSFLYDHYTDIYNRILKNELNLAIMARFLHTLQKIETGELDQMSASVTIGTLLKEMYVDSAIRKGEHLDAENPKPQQNDGKTVSWKEYKNYIR